MADATARLLIGRWRFSWKTFHVFFSFFGHFYGQSRRERSIEKDDWKGRPSLVSFVEKPLPTNQRPRSRCVWRHRSHIHDRYHSTASDWPWYPDWVKSPKFRLELWIFYSWVKNKTNRPKKRLGTSEEKQNRRISVPRENKTKRAVFNTSGVEGLRAKFSNKTGIDVVPWRRRRWNDAHSAPSASRKNVVCIFRISGFPFFFCFGFRKEWLALLNGRRTFGFCAYACVKTRSPSNLYIARYFFYWIQNGSVKEKQERKHLYLVLDIRSSCCFFSFKRASGSSLKRNRLYGRMMASLKLEKEIVFFCWFNTISAVSSNIDVVFVASIGTLNWSHFDPWIDFIEAWFDCICVVYRVFTGFCRVRLNGTAC